MVFYIATTRIRYWPGPAYKKVLAALVLLMMVCSGCAQQQQELPTRWTSLAIQNDSGYITVIPGNIYKRNSIFYKFLFGEHYRDVWQKPIMVRVFNPHSDTGSFIPVKKGGGDQTYSLDVLGPDSLLYSIRSVNKDQAGIINDRLQWLPIKAVVRDQASAVFPYGAAICSELQIAAGIIGTRPELVFVPLRPDNEIISQSDSGFLGWFEIEPDEQWYGHPLLGSPEKIVDTREVLDLHKAGEVVLDSTAYLKQRLFDILVGDWDRHDRQVDWGIKAVNGQKKIAYPIAMDRDMAFYRFNDGLLPAITEKLQPKLVTYSENYASMDRYVASSELMDVTILGNTPLYAYLDQALTLQEKLDEETIGQSFAILPASVQSDAEEIEEILSERLEELPEVAASLYNYIQHLKKYPELVSPMPDKK